MSQILYYFLKGLNPPAIKNRLLEEGMEASRQVHKRGTRLRDVLTGSQEVVESLRKWSTWRKMTKVLLPSYMHFCAM